MKGKLTNNSFLVLQDNYIKWNPIGMTTKPLAPDKHFKSNRIKYWEKIIDGASAFALNPTYIKYLYETSMSKEI